MTVNVPAGYRPDRPAPLLIVLHGYSSSGQEHDTYLNLGRMAEQRGFLYAYPDGTFDTTGNRFWNATDACCDFDRSHVDDAGYLADVIAEVGTSLALDPKRVYLVGHSNGGFMSYGMSCAHADLIAAMVSLAGATFAKSAMCAPTVPVAVLQIHGTADDTVVFTGGTLEGLGSGQSMAAYPGAETSVSIWAKYDGCTTSSVVAGRVDVDADLAIAGFSGRVEGDPVGGLSTWRGRRAVDDPGRRPRPEPLGVVSRGRPGLPREPPEAVARGWNRP